MSYDLLVLDLERPMEAEEAQQWAHEQLEAPPAHRIRTFMEALEHEFPSIDDDASPWASYPFDVNGPALWLNVSYSRMEEALPRLAALVEEHGLALLDLQSEEIALPPRLFSA